MKRILITGKGSYIGTHLKNYLWGLSSVCGDNNLENLQKQIGKYTDLKISIIHFTQNEEYLCIGKKVKVKTKISCIAIFNSIIRLLNGRVSLITKVSGDLIYEK